MLIPENIAYFFWDTDAAKLTEKDWFFIIERLLDYGNDSAISWVLANYSEEQIKTVTLQSRRLKLKTAHFWKNHFRLRKEDLRCLHELSPTNYWNY